jgi:hypothetical protein
MATNLGPDRPGRYEPFERFAVLANLLLALGQVLLAVVQVLRLIGC